jgi:hypothetical protein
MGVGIVIVIGESVIEYECHYKPKGTVWKRFEIDAESGENAIEEIKAQMDEWNVDKYYIHKNTRELIKFERGSGYA